MAGYEQGNNEALDKIVENGARELHVASNGLRRAAGIQITLDKINSTGYQPSTEILSGVQMRIREYLLYRLESAPSVSDFAIESCTGLKISKNNTLGPKVFAVAIDPLLKIYGEDGDRHFLTVFHSDFTDNLTASIN
jgi:hypothetical protein